MIASNADFCDKMEEVQIFDAFIDPFEKMLRDIRQKDQPTELLVNVSSGTPAIGSTDKVFAIIFAAS